MTTNWTARGASSGRDEQGPHDVGVEEDGHAGAEAELLEEDHAGGDEGAEGDGQEDGSGRGDRAGVLEAAGDGLLVGGAAVAGFLDAGEEEDAVISAFGNRKDPRPWSR